MIVAVAIACAAVSLVAAWWAGRRVRDARDAAARAGIAAVMARQSADRAERAAGIVAWPEQQR